jgi:hypothetical protein
MKIKFNWKLKEVLSTIKEICLLIIGGLIIFPIVSILGVFYSFGKHLIVKRDYSISKQLNPVLRSFTLASDGLACAAGGEMLNDALKIKGKIKYGNWYQTISAVTGLIQIYEKDTWLRRLLDKVLEKDHCRIAITEQESFYYSNNNNI